MQGKHCGLDGQQQLPFLWPIGGFFWLFHSPVWPFLQPFWTFYCPFGLFGLFVAFWSFCSLLAFLQPLLRQMLDNSGMDGDRQWQNNFPHDIRQLSSYTLSPIIVTRIIVIFILIIKKKLETFNNNKLKVSLEKYFKSFSFASDFLFH